jgi:hypothetical protein
VFGHVTASIKELNETQLQRYRSVYCGICRQIRLRSASHARFALGRFIYLADAAEDFAKDQKKHRYNPFLREDWAQWEAWLVMAMGRCTRFYDMLPIVQDKEILDNILFSGVWTRFRAAQHRAEKGKEARHE